MANANRTGVNVLDFSKLPLTEFEEILSNIFNSDFSILKVKKRIATLIKNLQKNPLWD